MSKRRFHYVITLHAPTARGVTYYTTDGLVTDKSGADRQQLFREIFERARLEMVPVPEKAIVTFFSLEPNDLSTTDTEEPQR